MGFPLHPSASGRYEGVGRSGATQSVRTSFSQLYAGGDLV